MTSTTADHPSSPALPEPMPSWVLPPRHPAFCFSAPGPLRPSKERFDLWSDAGPRLEISAWERVVALRRGRSWWLDGMAHLQERIRSRVARTTSLLPAVRRLAAESLGGGCRVRSIVLTGSYLWSDELPETLDVGVVFEHDGEPPARVLHRERAALLPSELAESAATSIRALDMFLVDASVLERAHPVPGVIGEWTTPDGRPFPYDLRARTVLAAVRQTWSCGIPVHGPDCFADVDQAFGDLVALAYYFTQEASVLLAYGGNAVKAARRLLEANLILRFAQAREPGSDCSAANARVARCVEAVRAAVSGPVDRVTLTLLHDGGESALASLLHDTVDALPVQPVDANVALARAAEADTPAWAILRARFERTELCRPAALLVHALRADPSSMDRTVATVLPSALELTVRSEVPADGLLRDFLALYLRIRTQGLCDARAEGGLVRLDREAELLGIARALLGRTPLRVWLGDPACP